MRIRARKVKPISGKVTAKAANLLQYVMPTNNYTRNCRDSQCRSPFHTSLTMLAHDCHNLKALGHCHGI